MLDITFQSDEQSGYSLRVNWGSGKYFPLYESATIEGQALDNSGNPVGNTTIRIHLKSSINSSFDQIFFATTDNNGNFSRSISSPTGAGSSFFTGAGLDYAYDVHSIDLYMVDPAGALTTIATVTQTDDVSTVSTTNSSIKVNDVAYYF